MTSLTIHWNVTHSLGTNNKLITSHLLFKQNVRYLIDQILDYVCLLVEGCFAILNMRTSTLISGQSQTSTWQHQTILWLQTVTVLRQDRRVWLWERTAGRTRSQEPCTPTFRPARTSSASSRETSLPSWVISLHYWIWPLWTKLLIKSSCLLCQKIYIIVLYKQKGKKKILILNYW